VTKLVKFDLTVVDVDRIICAWFDPSRPTTLALSLDNHIERATAYLTDKGTQEFLHWLEKEPTDAAKIISAYQKSTTTLL
jgi:hypothetical protein